MPIIMSYGFDSYNQAIETETAQPLRSYGGGDTTAKVVVYETDNIQSNKSERSICGRRDQR